MSKNICAVSCTVQQYEEILLAANKPYDFVDLYHAAKRHHENGITFEITLETILQELADIKITHYRNLSQRLGLAYWMSAQYISIY